MRFSLLFVILFVTGTLQARVSCTDVFRKTLNSDSITMEYDEVARVETRIDLWSEQRYQEMIGVPFRYVEVDAGRAYEVGPVVVHRMSSLNSFDQVVVRGIYERSIRPSWINESAKDLALYHLERLLDEQGFSQAEVDLMYPRDGHRFRELVDRDTNRMSMTGIELGKVVVKLKDGRVLESDFFTNYLENALFDIHIQVEDILVRVGRAPIESIKFYHSHPAYSSHPANQSLRRATAVVSPPDIQVMWALRDLVVSQNGSTSVEYHVYAVARVGRSYSIGHHSFRD